MIIAVSMEKSFNKILYPFIIIKKKLSATWELKVTFSTWYKLDTKTQNPRVTSIFNDETSNTVFLRSGTR